MRSMRIDGFPDPAALQVSRWRGGRARVDNRAIFLLSRNQIQRDNQDREAVPTPPMLAFGQLRGDRTAKRDSIPIADRVRRKRERLT